MTIILPKDPWARRRMLLHLRWQYKIKRRFLRKISKTYRMREFVPGAKNVHWETINGHRFLIGSVEFKPFRFDGPTYKDGLVVQWNDVPRD